MTLRNAKSAALIAMLITAIVYWQATTFELLLYDDPAYVSENPYVTQGLTWESFRWALTTGYFGNWHPLTWLSLQLDVTLGGGSSMAFHRTNVLLHVATTGILALVFTRWTSSWVAGLVAAILYGIHPMHVESVAWVAERKGLLSTFFLSLSLFAYLGFIDRPGLKRGTIVLVLFVMSLMAKPMGVTLPLLLIFVHWIYPGSADRHPSTSIWSRLRHCRSSYLRLYCGLILASAVFAFIAYQTQSAASALDANVSLSIPNRLATVAVNYVRYLKFYLWPVGFSFNLKRDPEGESVWAIVSSALMIGFALFQSYRWRQREPYVSFAIAWYFIAFLPVIGFLQVGNQVMAMRYSDWPLLGVHLLVAQGFTKLLSADRIGGYVRPMMIMILAMVTLILASRSRVEAKYWANDYSLYSRSIEVAPENGTGHAMLGRYFMGEGEVERAIGHLEKAISLNPENAEALSNLALLEFNRGNHQNARELSTQSLVLRPGKLEPQLVQGMLLTVEGSYDKAEQVFHEVLQAYPGSYLAWFNLASVYRRQGRYQDALHHYQQSLEQNSSQWQAWYFIAQCLEFMGDFRGATTAYSRAIRNSSGSSDESIRGFLRIRLVCGDIANLGPLISRLEITGGSGQQDSEEIMYLVSRDSTQVREEVSAWITSQSSVVHNDPFVYETLGDAYCYLGDSQAADEMWFKADSLWTLAARESARKARQVRRSNLELRSR